MGKWVFTCAGWHAQIIEVYITSWLQGSLEWFKTEFGSGAFGLRARYFRALGRPPSARWLPLRRRSCRASAAGLVEVENEPYDPDFVILVWRPRRSCSTSPLPSSGTSTWTSSTASWPSCSACWTLTPSFPTCWALWPSPPTFWTSSTVWTSWPRSSWLRSTCTSPTAFGRRSPAWPSSWSPCTSLQVALARCPSKNIDVIYHQDGCQATPATRWKSTWKSWDFGTE